MADTRKLALVGYGKMGQMIERLAPGQGFEVVLRLDEHNNADGLGINPQNFHGIDVAIEFSHPNVAPGNLKRLAETGVNAVTGTTGWLKDLDEVTQAVQKAGTGLVWSPNLSDGGAMTKRMVAKGAELLKDKTEYFPWAWDIHHDAKQDNPSGTLLQLVHAAEEP